MVRCGISRVCRCDEHYTHYCIWYQAYIRTWVPFSLQRRRAHQGRFLGDTRPVILAEIRSLVTVRTHAATLFFYCWYGINPRYTENERTGICG